MPELPEVECIVRDLNKYLKGKKITGVFFIFYQMLQGVSPEVFGREIRGEVIQEIKRRGKYILFFLSNDKILEVHLRMTGRLYYYSNSVAPEKYTGAVFYLDGGDELHYQDIRKFGTFRLHVKQDLSQLKPYLLGLDPLEDNFTLNSFLEILKRNPGRKIKPFLLDQKNIAGMGNIYTDETLFRAGIHPQRKVNSLTLQEIKKLFESLLSTLKEGIECRGTSVSDYRDIRGQEGEFQKRLKVYRREGAYCLRCGSTIQRKLLAGRGTYFCPSCQPLSCNKRRWEQ
ncbi:MAG TPA: DNA-formamidopyrimidine glycosylase [Firmicutes bacterium]|nr:DNA-formamidopyrimidine glycosylase [Bacillota bacterium]